MHVFQVSDHCPFFGSSVCSFSRPRGCKNLRDVTKTVSNLSKGWKHEETSFSLNDTTDQRVRLAIVLLILLLHTQVALKLNASPSLPPSSFGRAGRPYATFLT